MLTLERDGELAGWMRDEPVGPEERAWLEHAVALATEFGREVSDDVGSQMCDFIVIGRAAELLWAASPGSPRWRDLDVEAYLEAHERAHMFDWLPRDNVIASLFAFTSFLVKYKHITPSEALIMRSRLDPYTPAIMTALGYKPVELPASLRPS